METAKTDRLVLVQPEAPVAVQPETAFTRDAWESYFTSIDNARFDAHLHARYFGRVARWLRLITGLLSLVGVLSSTTVLLTLLAEVSGILPKILAGSAAVAAALLSVGGLQGRVAKAAVLAEAWSVRTSFWDDAAVMIRNRQYLGTLSELEAPEAALKRSEEELGLPEWRWYSKRVADDLIRTDHYASSMA